MTDDCTITDQREWIVERRKFACVIYECRPRESALRTVVATWLPESGFTCEHEHLFPSEIRSRTAEVCMGLWDQSSKDHPMKTVRDHREDRDRVSRWAHVASMADLTDEATAFGVAHSLRAQGAKVERESARAELQIATDVIAELKQTLVSDGKTEIALETDAELSWRSIVAVSGLATPADWPAVAEALRADGAKDERESAQTGAIINAICEKLGLDHESLDRAEALRIIKRMPDVHTPGMHDNAWCIICGTADVEARIATPQMVAKALREQGATVERGDAPYWRHLCKAAELDTSTCASRIVDTLRAQGAASALTTYPKGAALDGWRNVNDVPGFLFPAVDSNARSLDVFRSDLTGLLGLLIRDSDGNQIPDSGVAMGGRVLARLIGALIEIHGKMVEGDDGE